MPELCNVHCIGRYIDVVGSKLLPSATLVLQGGHHCPWQLCGWAKTVSCCRGSILFLL